MLTYFFDLWSCPNPITRCCIWIKIIDAFSVGSQPFIASITASFARSFGVNQICPSATAVKALG